MGPAFGEGGGWVWVSRGVFLRTRVLLVAASAAALGLSACETATYGAGGVISAAASPRIFAGVADIGALKTAAAPLARFEAAAAVEADAGVSTIHEQKASALFTGKLFLARGKILAAPAVESSRTLVELETPSGWRRRDNLLVHAVSGLECPLEFDFSTESRRNSLRLTDVASYDDTGHDVSCNYSNGGAAVLMVNASYHPEISVEDHAAAAIAAMRKSFTLKGVLPVIEVEIEDKEAGTTTADLEPPIAGAFDIGEIGGAPYKAALWIAKTHGWHVKARATYAQADSTTEIVSAVIFAVNYLNIDMKQKTDPAARGPEV